MDESEKGLIPEATDAQMREQMQGIEEIVLDPIVVEQLAKDGISPDDFVAMMLKKLGLSN